MFFEKRGETRYISHLDMSRFMARLVRRAELPILYTEGFNPHPYIHFAAPLSLGFESAYETVDFKVDDEVSCEAVFKAAARAMPADMRVFRVSEAVHKSAELGWARFEVRLSGGTDLAERVRAVLAESAILVEKATKKGGRKTLDIRPLIRDDEVTDTPEGGILLAVTLAATPEGSVNPTLLTDYIAGQNEGIEVESVVRVMLYLADGQEFV